MTRIRALILDIIVVVVGFLCNPGGSALNRTRKITHVNTVENFFQTISFGRADQQFDIKKLHCSVSTVCIYVTAYFS